MADGGATRLSAPRAMDYDLAPYPQNAGWDKIAKRAMAHHLDYTAAGLRTTGPRERDFCSSRLTIPSMGSVPWADTTQGFTK